MLPCNPVYDVPNGAIADVVFTGECRKLPALACECLSYCYDIGFGQATPPICCPSVISTAASEFPVLSVVFARTRAEMMRVAARGIVATVKNKCVGVRQFAAAQHESDAVRKVYAMSTPPPSSVLDTVASEVAIPRPLPALVRPCLADLLPKQFDLPWSNINVHRVLLTLGAMPGVVTAMPRLSVLSEQLYQIGRAI